MAVLVTGGAGFIGSHTCVELLNEGFEVVVVDNLANSSKESLKRVEEITGKKITFYEGDILNRGFLEEVFTNENIESVIHFAGLKAVGESVEKPWEYYNNNITGTLVLVDVMRRHNVKSIVFSSSATVYGAPAFVPITEECPKGEITNPYGQTKSMLEQVLTDIAKADSEWSVILLRYFNPIGAHESGKIGENPKGIPNNLMPYITQVAVGKRECLGVFGNDYDTHDGTGVRDYIHVVDLAKGHICAVKKLKESKGTLIYNLGTGKGYSVLDIVHAFEEANNIKIPYEIKPRRSGDIACCYADPTKAKDELNWVATKDIVDMCRDSYRWQTANPEGYVEKKMAKKNVTLVVMAAGIGSRFGGGIKQLEPVGPNGEIIMDYSIMDAKAAGFTKVVFVIRHDLEKDFMEVIGNRIAKTIDVDYAFQEIDNLPEGFTVPEGRVKPWGTGQAILACKGIVNEPFAVINADDYYGKEAFVKIYNYLTTEKLVDKGRFNMCMAGFILGNTLSDNGAVTRGVCVVNDEDKLIAVKETKGIVKTADGAGVEAEDGSIAPIDVNAHVSMNMWGLPADFISTLEVEFKYFLSKLGKDDIKAEFLLPIIIDNMIKSGKASVACLESKDKWFGVTYKEDKETVVNAIKELIAKGLY